MNMNYPQNWSWLLMIAAIVLWFHSPDAAVTLKVAFMSCTHQGVVTSFILVLLALLEPHVNLPSCRLHGVIEFLRQFVLKAKATQLRLPLALSRSLSLSLSLPVLFSQGLVLVLIKAVSFCLLPALSTACCELRGNSDTEWRGMRRWLNPEDGESKFWVTLPVRETCNVPPKARCLE